MPWAGFVKPIYIMELTKHGHPRRNDTTEWTEIEKAIYNTIRLIDEAGAHEFLTNSQIKIKLQEAATLYADWYEDVRGHVTLD